MNTEVLDTKINGMLSVKDKSLSEKETILNLEISKLEEAIQSKDREISTLKSGQSEVTLKYKLDAAINKVAGELKTVNSEANDFILDKLRQGASYEDDKIVFKNTDGTIVRNEGGVALTLADKLESFKNSGKFDFCFDSGAASGSGIQNGKSTNHDGKKSKIRIAKEKKMQELGLKVPL